ncbi:MAG: hypothetical protein O3C40_07715 [Planctomycetota bacterium]|nr:hypothetical protein [Planctomycetota bacterium]
MNFVVYVTDPAANDAFSIYQWLAERSAHGAANWKAAYRSALVKLQTTAGSFGLAPETVEFGEELHEMFFKTRSGHRYRLLFVIRGDIVHVARIRGPGQVLLSRDDINLGD